MARQISIYPGPSLERGCALNGGGKNRSHRIDQIADRYAEILRRTALPDFTDAEMRLMREAVGEAWLEPAARLRGGLAMIVEDVLEIGEAPGVEGVALMRKLAGLTFVQNVALIERIEAMRAGAD